MNQTLFGAGVGATIQVALQNIIEGPIDQIIQVCGVDEDMEKLKNSLLMIQDFMSDAEMKQVSSKAVGRWLEQLEDVAFEADAVLDEFNYEILRQKVESQNRAPNEVTAFFTSGPSYLLFRNEMANKIKGLNKRLKVINKEARNYGIQMAVMGAGQACSVRSPELQTNSFSVEPNIIGRENDVSELVNKLVMDSSQKKLSVIPVVGMGGIGKTRLAQEVFHHELIGANFAEKIWVCVSFNFDSMVLYKMILEKLTGLGAEAILSEDVVLEKIQKNMAGKRYLLVLDDIWNEEFELWDGFMRSLLGISSVMGNCIVVTTRSQIVALNVRTLTPLQLGKLSQDECWSIIKAKASLGMEISTEFEKIGKCIAETCAGLPLAAKLIGGLLRGKSRDEWVIIQENQLSNLRQNDDAIMKILKLVYDRLPSSSHKKCFAQDSRIKRARLIELWMAEGFLQADWKKDMETMGDEIFNHLLQHSLFQDAKRNVCGKISDCRMHDLVHDLACSVSGSRTISTKDDGLNRVELARYLAMKPDKEEANAILKDGAKYIRTLFWEGKVGDMFVGFIRLHVLKLMGNSIKELPDVIGKLRHLRLLDISEAKIDYIPDSIGKLYNLQTLSISHPQDRSILPSREHCHYKDRVKNLPSTIVDLLSLRHLHISGLKLPPKIGKLTSLRTLPYYQVSHKEGCGIGELGKLKNLGGELFIENLERVKNKEEAMGANLFEKPNILGLVLKWNETRNGGTNDQGVLEGLQPHRSLMSLEIRGYGGRNFPSWMMKMAAHVSVEGHRKLLGNLIKIKLENCRQCQEVPMLGHLPHLKVLELTNLPNVRSIGLSFYGFETVNPQEPTTAFPALEKLELLKMPGLTEWVEVDGTITVFPCLEYLKIQKCSQLYSLPSRCHSLQHLIIRFCPKLKSVQSHLPSLKELEVDEVDSDFSLADVCSSTSSLHSIVISSLPGLIYLPDELFTKNQNLTCLFIQSCPMLMLLVPHPLCSGASLKTLRVLTIRSCPRLTHLPRKLLESCSSSLQELTLHDLDNLENLATAVPFLSSLHHLSLMQIPKLTILPMDICCLRSLRTLRIGRFSESINFVSFYSLLFSNLSSLEELELSGKGHCDSLPDQIQHLTALQKLCLSNFGIEALPEWIGNLSSLRQLSIRNCEQLRLMASKEAMKRLNKLHELTIWGCPLLSLLEERCADDSEWQKISHVNFVQIDG